MRALRRVLLIGFGNPARRDDGLGPALAAAVERLQIPDVTVEQAYQLTVEDSIALGEHDAVVFADAAAVGPAPFDFGPVEPDPTLPWTSHVLEPKALVALAERLSGRRPEAYLLGIRGYDFDVFDERLSEAAEQNLAAALRFIEPVLRDGARGAAVGQPPWGEGES